MKIYRIRKAQRIPANLKDAWEFFSHPANIEKVIPKNPGFKIKERLPRYIYSGMLFTGKVKFMFGFSRSWVSTIIHEEEPNFFVDEQRFGPFRFWRHQHIFTEVSGGTEIEDIIHYALPFGIFGRVANSLFVARKLEKIFNHREVMIKRQFSMPPTD